MPKPAASGESLNGVYESGRAAVAGPSLPQVGDAHRLVAGASLPKDAAKSRLAALPQQLLKSDSGRLNELIYMTLFGAPGLATEAASPVNRALTAIGATRVSIYDPQSSRAYGWPGDSWRDKTMRRCRFLIRRSEIPSCRSLCRRRVHRHVGWGQCRRRAQGSAGPTGAHELERLLLWRPGGLGMGRCELTNHRLSVGRQ